MGKKVLIISTSIRSGSNSESLADAFAKGAQQAGNTVEFISLRGKNIGFCKGCLVCQQTQKCVIEDDAVTIAEKMKAADVVAMATPIYFYEMCGQMKTLLDRLNPLFPSDYNFRDVYLITAAACGEKFALEGVRKGMDGFMRCFKKATLKGVLAGLGLEGENEADGTAHFSAAYEMGKNV